MKTTDNNIGNDYYSFLDNLTELIRNSLNSCSGEEIRRELLEQSLKENPDMTKEEWEHIKVDFMEYVVLSTIKESPALMNEMAEHIYNELKKME